MSIKSFALASLLALGAFASNVQAAATWTMTTQGIIRSGYDSTGVFGVADRSLTGLLYTQSITANIDPSQWTGSYTNANNASVYGYGPAFTTEVSVDGVTRSFSALSTNWSQQYLERMASGGRSDYVYSYNNGTTSQGDFLRAYQYASSSSVAFVPTLDFNQALVHAMNPQIYGHGEFIISGSQTANIYMTINSISVNGTDVPERASLALLGLGLAGVAAASRKKSLSK